MTQPTTRPTPRLALLATLLSFALAGPASADDGSTAARALLQEIQQEAETTRSVLERVPADRLDWQPHETARSAGALAQHVAELPGLVAGFLGEDSVDFSAASQDRPHPTSVEELLLLHDESLAAVSKLLEASTDADLMRIWTLYREPGQPALEVPRMAVVRSFLINHWIHHRGQLSVYLRMLEAPVPSIYGPSGDELPPFLRPPD